MTSVLTCTRAALRAFSSFLSLDSRETSALSLSHKFTFTTAVYGHDQKNTPYKSKINSKWTYGDDACFIAKNDNSHVLGVADGVGGWREYGINPGDFSRTFMHACERAVKCGVIRPENPLQLAQQSYYDVLHLKSPMLGSATFCLLSLCRNSGLMSTANLGDSGYLVIRNNQLVAQSFQQKHSFNTPFQIALLPSTQNPRFHKDSPEDAYQNNITMKQDDIVVVGTDGLFDNLPVSMIIKEISLIKDHRHESLIACAQRLVDQAQKYSLTPDFISPFACEARSLGIDFKGGNPGDITVILGLVVLENVSVECQTEKNLRAAYS